MKEIFESAIIELIALHDDAVICLSQELPEIPIGDDEGE